MMLFLPSLLALLGGVGSLRIRSRRARNCFLMGAVTAASLAVLLLLMDGSAPDVTLLRIPPCFSLAFRADPVNRIFLGLVAVLWPLATLYAFEYMTAEEREPRFFAFFLASYAVTVPLALSANLFTLYLGYECLTLITLPLVTHREDGDSLRAGMVYLEFTVGGAANLSPGDPWIRRGWPGGRRSFASRFFWVFWALARRRRFFPSPSGCPGLPWRPRP